MAKYKNRDLLIIALGTHEVLLVVVLWDGIVESSKLRAIHASDHVLTPVYLISILILS
jgi:hypothetical protein